MKKLVALLVVLGLVIGAAGVYAADAAVKKAPVKKAAKKPVKKVVKPATKKAIKQPAPQVPVVSPLEVVPPPPPPQSIAPPPPPAPAVGLLGCGWNSSISAGYLAGKSVVVGQASLWLDDPLGLGSMVGLGARAINYRIGLGGATGNDINENSIKAVPLFIDAILNLPADVMGGLDTYVGGGLNYCLYGTDRSSGNYGIDGFIGLRADLGWGGKSFAEAGYSMIRSGSLNKRSAKGLTLYFGQQFIL